MDGTNFSTQTFLVNEDLNFYIPNSVTGTEIFLFRFGIQQASHQVRCIKLILVLYKKNILHVLYKELRDIKCQPIKSYLLAPVEVSIE
jgi:hypothetical protein